MSPIDDPIGIVRDGYDRLDGVYRDWVSRTQDDPRGRFVDELLGLTPLPRDRVRQPDRLRRPGRARAVPQACCAARWSAIARCMRCSSRAISTIFTDSRERASARTSGTCAGSASASRTSSRA